MRLPFDSISGVREMTQQEDPRISWVVLCIQRCTGTPHNADPKPVVHGRSTGPVLVSPSTEDELHLSLRHRGMEDPDHGVEVPEHDEEFFRVIGVN